MDADKPVCPLCGKTPHSEQGAAFIETYGHCVMCHTQDGSSEQEVVDAMAETRDDIYDNLDDWDPMDVCGYYDDRGR